MRPRIRATGLTGYAELAASVGLDPDRLAAEVGLDPADVGAPDRWVTAAAAARLLERSAQLSGCAEFGLRLAAVRQLGMLGPLSVVLRDEPTLGTALELLIRYAPSYDESVHMRLGIRAELSRLELWLDLGEPAATTQLTDLVVGSLLATIRALVGAGWLPDSVSFTHGPPDDPGPYRQACGPRVRFGADSTALILPTRQLERAVITSDPSLRPYTRTFLRGIRSSGALTTTARTTEIVELLLPLGRCSVQQVARQLGLPPRELQRRLAEEDASYSAVVDSVRAHAAARHLENGRRSLTEISQLLGFEAPSAFSRWFAQHFGSSPSAWRSAAPRRPTCPGAGRVHGRREPAVTPRPRNRWAAQGGPRAARARRRPAAGLRRPPRRVDGAADRRGRRRRAGRRLLVPAAAGRAAPGWRSPSSSAPHWRRARRSSPPRACSGWRSWRWCCWSPRWPPARTALRPDPVRLDAAGAWR